LALTLIAFLDVKNSIYLIEEPENGIHPLATEAVIRAVSHVYDCQVLCASHSPVVLSTVTPSDLLVFARDEQGATDVVPGDLHPRLRDWQAASDLGTLFAAGVLGGQQVAMAVGGDGA
jgi:predicted ATPase